MAEYIFYEDNCVGGQRYTCIVSGDNLLRLCIASVGEQGYTCIVIGDNQLRLCVVSVGGQGYT